MALRDQPYLPLYVQDYLTDEKLSMCSWSTQGVYIKLMCLLHKSEPYGTILLKQKDKQTENYALNFAIKITNLLPIDRDILYSAITELLEEGCLNVDGDKLFQKRMVRDNELSNIRAEAGKKGGKKTQKFAKAKNKANTEYEYIYEDDNNIDNRKRGVGKKEEDEILKNQFEVFRQSYPGTKRGLNPEFENFIKKNKNWREIVSLLSDALSYQKSAREIKRQAGGFIPEWKNLQTWINQKCWEEEIETNNLGNGIFERNSKAPDGSTIDDVVRDQARKLGLTE